MKVIIINGAPGVGKTTFENYCIKYAETNCFKVSTIDYVKYVAASCCGWTHEKTLKDRKFLSELKQIMTDYNDYPYIKTLETINTKIKKLTDEGKYDSDKLIIFISCRELEQIQSMKRALNAKTLVIRRMFEEAKETSNRSDKEVNDMTYDYEIWNTEDLPQLENSAIRFIEKVQEEEWNSYLPNRIK